MHSSIVIVDFPPRLTQEEVNYVQTIIDANRLKIGAILSSYHQNREATYTFNASTATMYVKFTLKNRFGKAKEVSFEVAGPFAKARFANSRSPKSAIKQFNKKMICELVHTLCDCSSDILSGLINARLDNYGEGEYSGYDPFDYFD